MLVAEPPQHWQLELLAEQELRTYWEVLAPGQPQLNDLGCQAQQHTRFLQWCEVEQVMWVLQYHGQRYWLTRWQLSPQTQTNSWRGHLLQRYASAGKQISIYVSEHHLTQLVEGMKFRFAQRHAYSLELDHGRYHLVLQNPREDIFLFQLEGRTMVVSISAQN